MAINQKSNRSLNRFDKHGFVYCKKTKGKENDEETRGLVVKADGSRSKERGSTPTSAIAETI